MYKYIPPVHSLNRSARILANSPSPSISPTPLSPSASASASSLSPTHKEVSQSAVILMESNDGILNRRPNPNSPHKYTIPEIYLEGCNPPNLATEFSALDSSSSSFYPYRSPSSSPYPPFSPSPSGQPSSPNDSYPTRGRRARSLSPTSRYSHQYSHSRSQSLPRLSLDTSTLNLYGRMYEYTWTKKENRRLVGTSPRFLNLSL